MFDLSLVRPNDLWYVIGLIATDGNLSIDKRHITITSKDRETLIAIKDALGFDAKKTISRKSRGTEKEKKYSALQFSDVKLYKFLESIGLTQKKSLTLGPIKVPSKYFTDFLRGVIDGDGNIQETTHTSNGNIQWVLRIVSGSPHFLPWLKESIQNWIRIEGKLYISKSPNRNPMHILKFGKFAAKIILKKCYYEGALAMERKLKKAQKCILSENGLSKYGALKAS
jgi:hypothetical protein